MNETDFDRQLSQWLRAGPSSARPRVLQTVIAHAHSHSPAGGLPSLWHDMVESVFARRLSPLAIQPVALVVMLTLSFALGAFVYGSWQRDGVAPPPSPTPSEPSPTPSPPPRAASCPVGTNPDRPGPRDQARPRFDIGPAAAFDQQSGHIVAVEQEPPKIWVFDVCTNTWHSASAAIPEQTDVAIWPGAMTYDEGAGGIVLVGGMSLASYFNNSDTLTVEGSLPDDLRYQRSVHVVYRKVTGQLIVRDDDRSRLWAYTPHSGKWEELAQEGDLPPGIGTGAPLLAYDTSADMLVLYARIGAATAGYVYDFASAAWSRHATDPPEVELVWGDLGKWEIAYDEAHARTVVLSWNRVVTYDAGTGEWDIAYDEPREQIDVANRAGVTLVYDGVNERIVVLGGHRWGDEVGVFTDEIVAFDLDNNSWTVLLEASGAQ